MFERIEMATKEHWTLSWNKEDDVGFVNGKGDTISVELVTDEYVPVTDMVAYRKELGKDFGLDKEGYKEGLAKLARLTDAELLASNPMRFVALDHPRWEISGSHWKNIEPTGSESVKITDKTFDTRKEALDWLFDYAGYTPTKEDKELEAEIEKELRIEEEYEREHAGNLGKKISCDYDDWHGYSKEAANMHFEREGHWEYNAEEVEDTGKRVKTARNVGLDFYEDPAHGWLKVKKDELVELGIADKISGYSFQKGDWAYLEEDSDATLYMDTIKAKGIQVDIRPHITDNSSGIRRFEGYSYKARER